MPYLTELTLTGTMRYVINNGAIINTDKMFSTTKYPLLKKLHIVPTEVLTTTGGSASGQTWYNQMKTGNYVFSESNLTELTIGKVGGPYAISGGYFRNDMPVPPGINGYSIGSSDGLTLKIYVASYLTDCGFLPGGVLTSNLASNTTVIQYDYLTGEVLTA